jgi:hypothetical protein
MILSEMSAPIQHSPVYPETPSEGDVLPEEFPFSPPVFDVTSDEYSITDGDSQVSENTEPSRQSRASLQAEGVTPAEPTITAGTSQRGRVHTMSRRMAESIAQGLHHVESTMGETVEDLFHDAHLELQELMRNPIAFHAKMMGDIMYLQQAIRQSDAKEFVQAVLSRKSTDTWIPTTGPSRNDMKFLMTPRLYLLYGPCGTRAISQLTKPSLTRPG